MTLQFVNVKVAISIKLNQDFKGFGIDNDDDGDCCNFNSFTFSSSRSVELE